MEMDAKEKKSQIKQARRYMVTRKYIFALAISFIGFLLSFILFKQVDKFEIKHIQSEFNRQSQERANMIRASIMANLEILYSIGNFYASSDAVERSEFKTFVNDYITRHDDIMAFEWIVRVLDVEKATFEEAARAGGLEGFVIKQLDEQGRLIPVKEKKEYFSVYYVEPFEANKAILGFDLTSDPLRLEAMVRSRDEASPVTTRRIYLLERAGRVFGCRIFLPVYKKGAPIESQQERRDNIIGFVSIVLRIDELVDLAIAPLSPAGIDVYFYDEATATHDNLIYFHKSSLKKNGPVPLRVRYQNARLLPWQTTFEVAGRQWRVFCLPTLEFSQRHNTLIAPIVLMTGLFLSIILGLYIFRLVGYARNVALLVDERTEQLHELSRAIEQSPSVVLITDLKGNIEYVNPKFCRLTNYSAEEVIGKNPRILNSGELPQIIYTDLWRAIKAGSEWHGEFHNRKKSGEYYWEYASISAIKDKNGRPTHYLKVAEDITRRKQLEGIKDEFVSTVSHELRTPLAITKEGISLVLDKIAGDINEKQAKILNTARGNIDRLTRIINDLLDISKIESGKLLLRRNMVDMVDIAKKAILLFEPKVKEKGVEIRFDFFADKIEVYADYDKIMQVMTNLLDNAVKFTTKGYIRLSISDKANEIECIIEDTGVGISKENLPKVFSKFQQFNRPNGGSGEKGTGLGLSIVKAIVEMHAGNIEFESEAGKGTKFIFTLPKYTPESLYKQNVNDKIDEAMHVSSKVSIILISVADFSEIKKAFSANELSDFLRDIQLLIKTSLRQTGDVVIKDTGELVVILTNCNKDNVLRVEGRLDHALEDYIKGKKLGGKISLRFGTATYPDEGKTNKDLIEKARQSEG